MRTPHSLPLAAVFALMLAVPAGASASKVTKQADSDDGNCTVANCSLRDAIKYGPANDVINVPAGTYHLNPGSGFGQLVVSHPLTIAGAPRGPTTITADGNHRVLDIADSVASGPVTLRRITVTGGNGEATGQGGGIFNESGKLLTLDHTRVTGNNADFSATVSSETLGGAGLSNNGPLTVMASSIDHNTMTLHGAHALTASGGGGVFTGFGAVTISGSEVRDNTVIISGAESTVADEVEKDGGGGIFELGVPSLSIRSSTIAGNSVTIFGGDPNPHESGGGGVYGLFGSVATTNATISGNTVDVHTITVDSGGGGVYSNQAGATFASSTIADNTASSKSYDAGGALYRYGGTVKARDTIFARNKADFAANCLGNVSSQGHNLDGDDSCGLTGPGDKTNVVKPLLGPLGAHGGSTRTQLLFKGSPAINAGALCPKVDQRGHSRPRGPRCDIGAVEADVPNVLTGGTSNVKKKSAKLKGTVNPNGFATTYRFEFGKTKSYGKKTASKSAGSGTTGKAIALKISKLTPGTTYHYRLIATNAFGTTAGADKTFKTKK